MNAPKDQAKHLEDLRERFRLYEQIPVIEEAHPAAIEPLRGQVIFCCHDTANDCVHHLLHEGETEELNSLSEDGNASPEMLVQIRNALAAAYN